MLSKAICPGCGAALEIDREKGTAVCPYCGTACVVDKVRDIHVHNTANAETLYARNVQIGESRADVLYQAAVALLRLGDRKQAESKLEQLISEYPGDPRGWWEKVRLLTDGLTCVPEETEAALSAAKQYSNACGVSPDPKTMQSAFADCRETMRERYKDAPARFQSALEKENSAREEADRLRAALEERRKNRLEKQESDADKKRTRHRLFWALCAIAFVLSAAFLRQGRMELFFLSAAVTAVLFLINAFYKGPVTSDESDGEEERTLRRIEALEQETDAAEQTALEAGKQMEILRLIR